MQIKWVSLICVSNISALTPGVAENPKEDWDPINQWLISLRHLGVATIILHHAGKGGLQRGTSGREDAMDTIIKLDYPKNYDPNEDYAWFNVGFEKSRNLKPGESKRGFNLRVVPDDANGLTWEMDAEGITVNRKEQIMACIAKGEKYKVIADQFNISPGRISQICAEGVELEYLNEDKSLTRQGFALFGKDEDK